MEICYIPWAKSFFFGFLWDYWFFGLGGIVDWGKFNGERNCGGWGKLWLGFLDEVWGIMYNFNQKLLK